MKNPNWTREQALACFNLYCRIPFGKFHTGTSEVIEFANAIGRTPSAVAMKLGNFASFDPAHKKRNVKGLKNSSALDEQIWREFQATPNRIAAESEEAFNQLSSIVPALPPALAEQEIRIPTGPTEARVTYTMRLVQGFFRRTVLASYEYKCSFCALSVRELLNASHIVPWNASEALRADPRNGLCLCALHDRAFDRGFLGVDENSRLLVSKRLKTTGVPPLHRTAFLELEGEPINLPGRFLPSQSSLGYHRASVFR